MKYSEEKLTKAMSMQFTKKGDYYYIEAKSDKDAYKYKLTLSPISNIPICNCWWYTYRSMRYANKYGLCSHQLGFLYKFNNKKFWLEVSNDK